jgi:hypothetical protein
MSLTVKLVCIAINPYRRGTVIVAVDLRPDNAAGLDRRDLAVNPWADTRGRGAAMNGAEPRRDLVHFQLPVLDACEKLLASCGWDEARLNEALKSMMASMLPLLRAQRAPQGTTARDALGAVAAISPCARNEFASAQRRGWRRGLTAPHDADADAAAISMIWVNAWRSGCTCPHW